MGTTQLATYETFWRSAEAGILIEHVACPSCGVELVTATAGAEGDVWAFPYLSCDNGCHWHEFVTVWPREAE